MPGEPEDCCGDTGVLQVAPDRCFAALIDVLGHGRAASEVAKVAEQHLRCAMSGADLTEVMNGLHEHLKGTRGAVVSLCRIDIATGLLRFVGVGNITARITGSKPQRLLSRDGVVGYQTSKPREESATLVWGDIVVMHSDGISENADWLEHPDLLVGTAEEIANGVLRHFSKQNDDASCLVIRYLK